MQNNQKPEYSFFSEDGNLDVFGEPWLTIQGEGPFAGERAVFVRLAGCNLKCSLCDTDYTSKRRLYTPFELIVKAKSICPKNMLWPTTTSVRPLLVITGGEPFRQNIEPFCQLAIEHGFIVQIETNGTVWPYSEWSHCSLKAIDLSHRVTLVCSPKTSVIHPEIRKRIRNWKFIVEHGHVSDNGLPTRVLGMQITKTPQPDFDRDTVFIQPLDTDDPVQNQLNTKAASDVCLKHGYTLCLQVHKIAGLA